MTTNHDSEQAFRDLQADRRLRDAAPELLAALRAMLFHVDQQPIHERDSLTTQARAAIAKATQP